MERDRGYGCPIETFSTDITGQFVVSVIQFFVGVEFRVMGVHFRLRRALLVIQANHKVNTAPYAFPYTSSSTFGKPIDHGPTLNNPPDPGINDPIFVSLTTFS